MILPVVVLQQLARHADIQTTLTYYVQQDAEATAEVLWEAFSNKSVEISTGCFIKWPRLRVFSLQIRIKGIII